MREIVFDTETTGFDPREGHRLVEIGCVEIENYIPTGRVYHQYINPERDVPQEAVAVHGLDEKFLKDFPTFGEIVGDFVEFIGADAKLVAHNAEFDVNFLNYEMKTFGFPTLERRRVVDTLKIAREKFPGSPASLDALCRRFNIDNSNREFHGALLDSELLAEVYLELVGGRQHGLVLSEEETARLKGDASVHLKKTRPFREPRQFDIPEEELAAHKALLDQLKDPIWINKD
ncbi:MAG TPA: DNA polymerase III subunit epsilon [Rhodospirillaceae bacterium]|jgi:DNA polymerase-3 subunit epsilon|nr:DNA polymerase III subunit epsilon [Rhodospirillaceae bacterium]